MFTTDLRELNARQAELHKQAADYRLAQSLKRHNPRMAAVFAALGKALIVSGQQLMNRYQPAHKQANN